MGEDFRIIKRVQTSDETNNSYSNIFGYYSTIILFVFVFGSFSISKYYSNIQIADFNIRIAILANTWSTFTCFHYLYIKYYQLESDNHGREFYLFVWILPYLNKILIKNSPTGWHKYLVCKLFVIRRKSRIFEYYFLFPNIIWICIWPISNFK